MLTKPPSGERGSAPVEAAFALVIILFLVLGTIEVAFALYGRNVVIASAHEGARAAIELGRSSDEAGRIAEATVRRAAGGLVDDLEVAASVVEVGDGALVRVRVRGTVDALGPIPFPFPVTASATASRDGSPR